MLVAREKKNIASKTFIFVFEHMTARVQVLSIIKPFLLPSDTKARTKISLISAKGRIVLQCKKSFTNLQFYKFSLVVCLVT